jgi:hypothetical protein
MGEEVRETVMGWLNGLVADFHNEGIIKLVQVLDKCLNSIIWTSRKTDICCN